MIFLIEGPGAVTGINITASVDSLNVTWDVPEVKTGPTKYFVEACLVGVDHCDVDSSCEERTVEGVFGGGKVKCTRVTKMCSRII